ncbi:Csu type fimbrial protein [Marilutibacter alkalisoli]|uniref:Spore coat protein U domain-containing protein n=1 Tax=Marilutibacter alkalisoli TaxID=2591633 RepID=A0A514BTB6_9GAMM|nr:spore coat protein U domain-containing protein [Lysobacter alkalisoli]QDH70623.1 spore coat protein U domain-containing protein [Lysobacter alkalisoli]
MIRSHPVPGAALLLFALLWLPAPAQAVTTCTASSTALNFGTVTGTGNVDSTAVVTVVCNTSGLSLLATARVRMCLNIGAGANGGGLTNPRRMTNSFGDAMQFQIYRDPARTLIWGDSSIPATPTPVQIDLQYDVPVLGGSGSTTATMHARVPAQAGLAAGLHSNPFTGTHTRLDYRYAEALLGTPNYPASCTSGGGGGGTATFPFTASATVPDNCVIATATALDFGSVPGPVGSNIDQTSTITMTCTARTAWNVALDNGQNAVGLTRRMRLGATGSYVDYELYRDAGRSLRWGATIGTDTVPGTGTGTAQALTVHGRVPATQSVAAGNYSDVVTVTVTY